MEAISQCLVYTIRDAMLVPGTEMVTLPTAGVTLLTAVTGTTLSS